MTRSRVELSPSTHGANRHRFGVWFSWRHHSIIKFDVKESAWELKRKLGPQRAAAVSVRSPAGNAITRAIPNSWKRSWVKAFSKLISNRSGGVRAVMLAGESWDTEGSEGGVQSEVRAPTGSYGCAAAAEQLEKELLIGGNQVLEGDIQWADMTAPIENHQVISHFHKPGLCLLTANVGPGAAPVGNWTCLGGFVRVNRSARHRAATKERRDCMR
jgi:hypothetical protein